MQRNNKGLKETQGKKQNIYYAQTPKRRSRGFWWLSRPFSVQHCSVAQPLPGSLSVRVIFVIFCYVERLNPRPLEVSLRKTERNARQDIRSVRPPLSFLFARRCSPLFHHPEAFGAVANGPAANLEASSRVVMLKVNPGRLFKNPAKSPCVSHRLVFLSMLHQTVL
jgi:hypothetical protein